MKKSSRRIVFEYGMAIVLVALMMPIKAITDRVFGGGPPLILFFSAVMVASWIGGLGPGLLATVLSSLACMWFYFEPVGSLMVHSMNDAFRLGVFIIEATVLSALMHSLHRARQRVEQTMREAVQKEIALREGEERFHFLVESVEDYAIIMLDPDGYITSWNAGAERIKGYTSAEIVGKHFSCFYTPQEIEDGVPQNMLRSVALNGRFEGEGWRVRKNGSRFWAHVFIRVIKDDEGHLLGYSKVTRDVTARKQSEEALQQANEQLAKARDQAEEASRDKSEFLANMSHEIRTPMNGILGMLSLTLNSKLTSRQREFLTLAQSSAETLLRLLNDILDFSKIEAGMLQLESTAFGLREHLADTLKALAIPAQAKGLELTHSIAPDVPDGLLGDSGRLSQIIVNLVGNATKFTERGEVVVRVEKVTQTDDEIELRVTVRDTGIGIPAEKQVQIFAAFTQADNSMTRQYGGTGLGLTICAHLVQAMGGRIWVESQPSRGSSFHFTVRFGLQHELDGSTIQSPLPRRELAGLPVLVVDDNATNRLFLQELLGAWGLKPVLSDSGAAALAMLAEARKAGDPFPLVLLDALMPGMDGFAVAEQIQSDAGLAGTAIMMLSSVDYRDDTERCARLGISLYLRKPIRESDLFDSILSVLGVETRLPAPSAQLALPGPARRLRILLAEDTPVNRRLAVALLEDRGHKVVVANDGREALEVLATDAFDLILMDIQMPVMDGFQATAAIRASELNTGRHIPIIAMTAHAMKGDRERCLAAGMDGYVSKPIQQEQFLAAVEGQDCNDQLAADGADKAATGSTQVVFDVRAALARTQGREGLLREVIDLVREDYPRLLDQIRTAVATHDSAILQSAAHRLKGSVANLSAPRAVAVAQRLESIGRAGDFSDAQAACCQLEEEMARLEEALRAFGRAEIAHEV
jgi:PAS domain S-box-containing protein